MKHLSTWILRIALILAEIFVIGFIVLVIPEFTETLVANAPPWFFVPVLFVLYVTFVPFTYGLYQAFRLLEYIDRKTAFSGKSVGALKRIKVAAIIIAGLYAAILPLLYMAAQADDAPGLFAIGIVLAGAAVIVATLASVLQLVLQSAIQIKKENDLTV